MRIVYIPAWKVFVAIEQTSGAVKRVARIVNGGALFGGFVCRTQEYPLVGGRHLRARRG